MNTITRTDIKRMLDNRDRLERRVRELENELKNVKRELTETEAPLYALLGREDQVKRLKLDSRRVRRVLLKNADESRFKISEAPPVADFVSMCSSSIPGLVSIMADAFLECGGGVVIARHIRDLWITDPVFQFTHDVAGVIQAGCIVSDMRTVIEFGARYDIGSRRGARRAPRYLGVESERVETPREGDGNHTEYEGKAKDH